MQCDELLPSVLHALAEPPSVLGSLAEALGEGEPTTLLAKARSRESALADSPARDGPSGFSPAPPHALGVVAGGAGVDGGDDFFVNDAANLEAIQNDPRNESCDMSDEDEEGSAGEGRDALGDYTPAPRGMPAALPRPHFNFGGGEGRLPAPDFAAALVAEMSSGIATRRLRNTMAGTVERPRATADAPATAQGEELRSAELSAIFSRRKNGLSITPSKAPAGRPRA